MTDAEELTTEAPALVNEAPFAAPRRAPTELFAIPDCPAPGADAAPIAVDSGSMVLTAVMWCGAAFAALAVGATLFAGGGMTPGGVAIAVAVSVAAAFFVANVTGRKPEQSLPGRGVGAPPAARPDLLGPDALSSLRLSELVIEADEEARLITRRDGVVLYANKTYRSLAKNAGVTGLAGLPPRIDRLFSQQGGDATKLFRLCRAAKSGGAAEETISQLMGLDGGGARRRFAVSVRPLDLEDGPVSWRIRELPADDAEHEALAAAYKDCIAPIFALERSGQIAWLNAAMKARLGGANPLHIDEVALGETRELVKGLWSADGETRPAQLRVRGADPIDATFHAFTRGGLGEGFVCVLAEVATPAPDTTSAPASLNEAPFGIALIDGEVGRDAVVAEANKAFTDVFGSRKNAPLGRLIDGAAVDELCAEVKRKGNAGGAPRPVEATVGEGPQARHFALFARPVKRRRGAYGSRQTLLFTIDITDRKRMEQDHAQDQKLKALGQVAGGVAHDFNNLLQVILGNCEHLMLRHPAGDPAYQELVLIRDNAQRAANLTKQLLAYSRRQTLVPKVQSITDILVDFGRFLDRTVGEKVKVDIVNGRGLPPIRVDRGQLETAIMNLAVNARDAMAPEGGRLTIRTRALNADEVKAIGAPGLDPQPCVEIAVEDTGPGVPKAIADKIFDPFFTTKDEGKGTGLGLSTVFGVIGQMGGAIVLDDPDRGTAETPRRADAAGERRGATFRILLPAFDGEIEDAAEDAAQAAMQSADYTGAGRILVVEDEDAVRAIVVATLKRSGYCVTAASDGVDALEILAAQDIADFDLVISDIMMPEVDGPTFIERARAEHGLKAGVIFMSGYAQIDMRERLDRIEGAGYLQKPIPIATLGAKVKEQLGARAASA